MVYSVRLKTGFFETSAYTLSVRREGVTLTSADGQRGNIQIAREDIFSVTISMKKHPRFEIQTSEKIFSGVFLDQVEQRKLEREFGENLGRPILIGMD